MDIRFLEQFYENVILVQYSDISFGEIIWIDHGAIGPDTFAHYFKTPDNKEYVLVAEDFPGGTPFDDDLSHEIVPINGEKILRFGGTPHYKYIENITGYFTLYREKDRMLG